jgi:tetratricopeptide (TPR) repeat protein
MNQFYMSSWQIYRFWPDQWRLPFIDIHQTGTREDRDQYAFVQLDPQAWTQLDHRFHFDYALLARVQYPADRLLDALDADSSFALVFKDDVAALFVRREGALRQVAERFAYRVVPAGNIAIGALGKACVRDTALREPVRRELEREIAESPWHGQAKSLEANLALLVADWPRARALLDSVQAIDDSRMRLYLRFALIDLAEAHPRDALPQLARERAIHGSSPEVELAEGRAWAAIGDRGRARIAYQHALDRDPGFQEAADSLAALDRGGGS